MALIIPNSSPVPQESFTPVAGRQAREIGKAPNPIAGLAEEVNTIVGIMAHKQDEQDRITANNAYTSLQQESNIFLYGKEGFYRTSGEEAYRSTGATRVQLEEINDRIFAGLTPDQQKLYHTNSQSFMLRSNLGITKHEATQTKVAKSASLTSQIDNAITSGSLDYSKDSLDNENSSIMIAVGDQAEMNGLDSEARLSLLNKYQSKLYFGAAQGALAHDDFDRVQEIIDKHGDSILPNHLMSLKKALNKGSEVSRKGKVKAVSYSIVDDTFNGNVPLDQNIKEARKAAGKNLTAELARQIDSDVKDKANQFKIVKNQEHDANFAELQKQRLNGTPFNRLNPKDLVNLSASEIKSLVDMNQVGSDNKRGLNILSRMNPTDLKSMSLVKYFTEIGFDVNEAGYDTMYKFQKDSNKGMSKDRTKVHSRAKQLFKKFTIPEAESPGWFTDVPDRFEGVAVKLNSDEKEQNQTQFTRSKVVISMIAAQLIDDEVTRREEAGETTNLTDNEINDIFYKAAYTNEYNVGTKDIPAQEATAIISAMRENEIDSIYGLSREESIMNLYLKFNETGESYEDIIKKDKSTRPQKAEPKKVETKKAEPKKEVKDSSNKGIPTAARNKIVAAMKRMDIEKIPGKTVEETIQILYEQTGDDL